MKFVTNRIYTGQPTKTIEQIVKEAQAARSQSQVKTASAAGSSATVEATLEKEAKFPSGHEHKFKANTEKLKGKGGKGPEAPAEEKKDEKKKEAASEVEIKVAEKDAEKVEKYDAGKKEANEFTNKDIKEPTDADVKAASGGDKKPEPKKGKDGTETSGQPQWEGKKENNNDPWKDPKAKDDKKAASAAGIKLSVPSGRFEIVANLKPELKKRTKDYWRSLYGNDYAEAMVADK